MRLEAANVVVTGASSGIGRAVAVLLARKGARVLAVGRRPAPLEAMAREDAAITPLVADLTVARQRSAVVAAAGPVDVLVNNAGIGWLGLVEEMPADRVRALFELNVIAVVDLTQRVLEGMLERRRGHVVNVASVASWVSIPPLTVYSATKFAVQGFSEGVGREVAGRGVTVGTVNPGPVNTAFVTRARLGDRRPEQLAAATMPGVSPTLVARAVARSIRMAGVPGYSTIAVPRLAGLARLGAVPGLRLVVDAGSRLSRLPAPGGREPGEQA